MGDYITRDEFKSRSGIQRVEDDQMIDGVIDAAEQAVEDFCHRRFTLDDTATARLFYAENGPVELWLNGNDIGTTTDLAVKTDEDGSGTYETTWSAGTDYQLEPLNGINNGRVWAYTRIRAINRRWLTVSAANGARPPIQITAKWGWPSVPPKVTQAAFSLAKDLYDLKDVRFGASIGQVTEFGNLPVRRAVALHAQALLSVYELPVTG